MPAIFIFKVVKITLVSAISMISWSSDLPMESPKSHVIIDKIDGLLPSVDPNNPVINEYHRITGDKFIPDRGGPVIIHLHFIESVHDVRFDFNSYSSNCEASVAYISATTTYKDPKRADYIAGEPISVFCGFTPQKGGRYKIAFSTSLLQPDGRIKTLDDGLIFMIGVKPTIGWQSFSDFNKLLLIARSGIWVLIPFVLILIWLLWHNVQLSLNRIMIIASVWLVTTFIGQILFWILLDRLFVNVPEHGFTVFDFLNLPALISAIITSAVVRLLIRYYDSSSDPMSGR